LAYSHFPSLFPCGFPKGKCFPVRAIGKEASLWETARETGREGQREGIKRGAKQARKEKTACFFACYARLAALGKAMGCCVRNRTKKFVVKT